MCIKICINRIIEKAFVRYPDAETESFYCISKLIFVNKILLIRKKITLALQLHGILANVLLLYLSLFCMYMSAAYMCGACAHVCMGACGHGHTKARRGHQMSCSVTLCLISLRHGLSVNLVVWLVSRNPQRPSHLHPHRLFLLVLWPSLTFNVDAKVLNSGFHACVYKEGTHTMSYSLQPRKCSFFFPFY